MYVSPVYRATQHELPIKLLVSAKGRLLFVDFDGTDDEAVESAVDCSHDGVCALVEDLLFSEQDFVQTNVHEIRICPQFLVQLHSAIQIFHIRHKPAACR